MYLCQQATINGDSVRYFHLILTELEFDGQTLVKMCVSYSTKLCPVVVELSYTDRRTEANCQLFRIFECS